MNNTEAMDFGFGGIWGIIMLLIIAGLFNGGGFGFGGNTARADITNEFLYNQMANDIRANATIPLNLERNTNTNISYANNTVTINKAGHYSINATFNYTATVAATNIQMFANGVAIPETLITQTTTAGDEYEIVINDIETVIASLPVTNKVTFTFVTSTGLTLLTANVGIYELR